MDRGAYQGLEWTPLILMTVAAIVTVAMIVAHYAGRSVDAAEVHKSAYLARLLHDDILMYHEEDTGRTYPGVVDAEKLVPGVLDRVWENGTGIASRLSFSGCSQATLYQDEATFDRLLPLAQRREGATMRTHRVPVTVRHERESCAATMEITIVREKR